MDVATERVDIGNGVQMPILGLGTWQAHGRSAYDAVRHAVEIGYRHVDTATMYGNEREVGQALADSGVPRGELFVTTKLPQNRVGRERETINESLSLLGMEFIDLWLIHWPPAGRARPDVWEHFLEAQRDGLARAVGVSNYSLTQLDELASASGHMPAVNQVEWSPTLYDERTLLEHRRPHVQLEGYSPLKTTDLSDPRLVRIAEAHGVTPAQVVIRWHIEHRVVVIPKSSNPQRIKENADVFGFALTDAEVAELDQLSTTGARRR